MKNSDYRLWRSRGATAAARLRRRDESMEIVMLEGEYISFANCGLYYIGDVIHSRNPAAADAGGMKKNSI